METHQRAVFVYTTYPSVVEAEEAGRALLERRLCACVNILPGMVSLYWWEGKVERGEEVGIEAIGGVEDVRRRQGAPVAVQHVLQVRRAGLRRTDVQQDPRAHVFSSRRRIPSARTPASEGSETPVRSTGSRLSGSPWTA